MPGTLEDDYDATTLARIDRRAGRGRASAPRVAGGWRGHTAAGALAAGLVLGLAEVFAPDDGDPIIEEIDVGALDDGLAVRVALAPAAPGRSQAWVHPWLLA